MTERNHDAQAIIAQFQLKGRFIEAMPYGTGHINDTYLSYFQHDGRIVRYIHQWINHHVFTEPVKVMQNIERVTRYAREQIVSQGGDPWRETLNLIPTIDGRSFYQSPQGDTWRSYVFIEGARSYDQVADLQHVYQMAKAFGEFQKLLSQLPGERLHETIPDFHHTRKRFEAFVQALERDPCNRAQTVKPEIDFALQRAADASIIVDMLTRGDLPERVTHNDTKLSNVMIDDQTGAGVCVIDLDTVMPGSALYDFGDAVRIGASTAAEDERDLRKVGVDMVMFDRLAHGYLDATRDLLTPLEIELLAFSAKLLTFECGMRFLTDHLNGDTYFKIHRANHNLERCRTQFKLVQEMEEQRGAMERIVARRARS
jgi:hypothetical protein